MSKGKGQKMELHRSSRTHYYGLLAFAAWMGLFPGTVQAVPVLYDPDGLAPTNGTVQIGSLGFDTGNALAQASIAGGQATVGQTFQLFFQTRLTDLAITPGGGSITPAGLNGSAGGPAFETTAVGSVTEVVTSVTPGGSVTFAAAPVQSASSFIRMFYHPGLLSDYFTGAGFAVGTQILTATPSGGSGNFSLDSATINPFDSFDPPASAPGAAYAGITSVSGSGGSIINGVVTTSDPNFFKSPIISIRLDAFNNVPFTSTTPSQFFNSFANTPTVAANHGPVNGVNGPDIQFQSRSAASFAVVPEPASIALLILGLGALVGWRQRAAH
jgi:hypothetical protein